MELTRFELDAEKRDKRKVEALERLAAAAERIAAALEGGDQAPPAASESAGEEEPRGAGRELPHVGRRTTPKPQW